MVVASCLVAPSAVIAKAVNCKQSTLTILFDRSLQESRGREYNATAAEEISGENEAAFISCPQRFLKALSLRDDSTKHAVSRYFGLFDIEGVAASLRRLDADREIGPIVRRWFAPNYTRP